MPLRDPLLGLALVGGCLRGCNILGSAPAAMSNTFKEEVIDLRIEQTLPCWH